MPAEQLQQQRCVAERLDCGARDHRHRPMARHARRRHAHAEDRRDHHGQRRHPQRVDDPDRQRPRVGVARREPQDAGRDLEARWAGQVAEPGAMPRASRLALAWRPASTIAAQTTARTVACHASSRSRPVFIAGSSQIRGVEVAAVGPQAVQPPLDAEGRDVALEALGVIAHLLDDPVGPLRSRPSMGPNPPLWPRNRWTLGSALAAEASTVLEESRSSSASIIA